MATAEAAGGFLGTAMRYMRDGRVMDKGTPQKAPISLEGRALGEHSVRQFEVCHIARLDRRVQRYLDDEEMRPKGTRAVRNPKRGRFSAAPNFSTSDTGIGERKRRGH